MHLTPFVAFITILWAVSASSLSRPDWAPMSQHSDCLTAERAQYFVDSFVELLEFTGYNGTRAPSGRGFDVKLADQVLAEDFQDISDSIDLLAKLPLGTTTFPSHAAFVAGQSAQPEVNVTVLNIWVGCDTITFRYRLLTGVGANLPVVGINVMQLDSGLNQVKTQYAELNSGAWLTNLENPQCQG